MHNFYLRNKNRILAGIGLLIGLAIWEVIGRLGLSPAFPPVTDVLGAVVEVWTSSRFLDALKESMISVALALPPSIVFGVIVGVLMGRYRAVEWALDPLVNVFLSLPLVALIPVLFLIFGLGRGSILATIVIYTFFIVVVNTAVGVQTTDERVVEMARSFGANERQIVRRVVLPSALPLMFAGVRIAAGRAVRGVIIAEQVIGLIGLGGLVQRLGGAFAVENLYAVILFVGLLGLVTMESVAFAERRALPWVASPDDSGAALQGA
ncbi:MAG TPA: ABC transporter permease [Acidimicrobiia bacterium]|nr:ABC transporter permease [Acidimicrobiia bacterium]